jgi:hypothetical protein
MEGGGSEILQCAGGGKFENFVLKLELKMGSITKILITVNGCIFF